MYSRLRTCLLVSLSVAGCLAFAPAKAEAQLIRGIVNDALNGGYYNDYGPYGGYGGYGYPQGWGGGNLAYNSGYWQYSNPYYAGGNGGLGGYNYSQPLPFVANNRAANNPQGLDSALERFKSGDNAGALKLVDAAIQAQPSDVALHEFRALVLFAMQDYAQAAATIHTVLAQGPGWNWPTLSSLYLDVDVYTAQLRTLEAYTKSNPDKADGRFLLAYHYMAIDHPEAAVPQLQAVVRLAPTDRLAAELLTMVGGNNMRQGSPTNSTPTLPATQQADVKPALNASLADPVALVGTWHASRSDGSKFEFNLLADKTYVWNFQLQQRNESFSGTYRVEKAVLVLQRKEGGAMLGQVAFDGKDRFNFKLLGAPPEDTGLTFSR